MGVKEKQTNIKKNEKNKKNKKNRKDETFSHIMKYKQIKIGEEGMIIIIINKYISFHFCVRRHSNRQALGNNIFPDMSL